MTVVSVKAATEKPGASGTSGLRRIEFSDGTLISFKICYLSQLSINERLYTPGAAEGMEIGQPEKEHFLFASSCLRAENTALRLIARAEQNTFTLARKLEKRGHEQACIREAIARLCELNLLDDRRYAILWLESRISRQAASPRRLLAALCARGIDRDDAEYALSKTLDDDGEAALLNRYAEKLKRKMERSRKTENSRYSDARRSLSWLLKSEGFSYNAIHHFFES